MALRRSSIPRLFRVWYGGWLSAATFTCAGTTQSIREIAGEKSQSWAGGEALNVDSSLLRGSRWRS
jgi:hypothetical protein